MRCKRMYVNTCLPLAGGLIKQTTAATDWSIRSQRICSMMFAYKSAVGEGLAMQISDNLALDGDAVLNWSLIIVSR